MIPPLLRQLKVLAREDAFKDMPEICVGKVWKEGDGMVRVRRLLKILR